MENQNYSPKNLWVIHFGPEADNSQWFRGAEFEFTKPANLEKPVTTSSTEGGILGSTKNQLLALDFLEKINESFREITENYLSKIRHDEHTQAQVDDIRKKFDALDKWLHWLRSKIEHRPPEK